MTRNSSPQPERPINPEPRVRATPLSIAIAAALLIALVVVSYHAAPNNGFHFDDRPNIEDVPSVRMDTLSVGGLLNAAAQSRLEWRKIPSMTFAFDWWRGGGEPRAFQITNVLIHALTTLAVFWLAALVLTAGRGAFDRVTLAAAAFGAAVWAAHPIQVQAVTYIVQRMASLAALFTVLAVVAYIHARQAQRLTTKLLLFASSAVALAAAALSKENAWISPVLLVFAEYGVVRSGKPIFRHQVERRVVLALLAIGLAVTAVTLLGQGPIADRYEAAFAYRPFTQDERLLTQPRVLAFHASQLVWPAPSRFSLEHDFPVSTSLLSPPTTLFATIGVLFWVGAGFWWYRRRDLRPLAFAWLWVPITLLVESSVANIEIIFEHRMYLPTVGLGLALAWGTHRAVRTLGRPWAWAALGLGVVGILAIATVRQVPVWENDLTLSERSVQNASNSARAWSELGLAHQRRGNTVEAARALERSLELNPFDGRTLERYAVLLMDQGELEQAQVLFTRAALTLGNDASFANHVGELFLKLENFEEAERQFRMAIAQKPWRPPYYWNLALTLEAQGRCREAFTTWESYLAVERDQTERARVLAHLPTEQPPSPDWCITL